VTPRILAVLCGAGGIAMAKLAVTGKPRLIWGRRGANYLTRREQAIVCSFESIVLFFAAVINLWPWLPPSRLATVLYRMDQSIDRASLIFVFFSAALLALGISKSSLDSPRHSMIEKAIRVGATLVGAIILVTSLFQVIVAVRSSF
jgi:hypothetical protein